MTPPSRRAPPPRRVPLPPGRFRIDATDVLFLADQQYPLSALDMFWTELGVVRPDGSIPQNADSMQTYLGRQWRRYSWHRNGVWNPANNGLLEGHLDDTVRDRVV